MPPPDWFDESLFAEPSAYECELVEEREALIEHVSRCADDGIRDYVADPDEEAAFARWVEGQVADWACEDGEPDFSRQNADGQNGDGRTPRDRMPARRMPARSTPVSRTSRPRSRH